jgi:hypothetical protein
VTMRLTCVTIALAAVAGSAALTGCGAAARFVAAEETLDSGKLEHNIAALVATRYRVPETTVRVDCPGRIPGYQGTHVECEAAARGGRSARVLVTITSDGASAIKFDAAIVGNVNPRMVERSLTRRAARHYGMQQAQLAISCPSGVHAERGVQLTCRVRTDDGRSGRVRLEITSPTGKRLAFASRFTAIRRS